MFAKGAEATDLDEGIDVDRAGEAKVREVQARDGVVKADHSEPRAGAWGDVWDPRGKGAVRVSEGFLEVEEGISFSPA